MTITPTEGPGTADPVSQDGLVLPSAFVCRWTELDTAAINSGADSLRSMGNSVRDEVGGMRATWSSLPASYEGPEQELVYTLLDDPRDAAEDLKERFFAAAVQLDTYATILFDIALELMDLDTRAWDFREEALAGYDERKAQQRSGNSPVHYETEHVSWRENTAAVARNEALVQEYAGLLARISSAAVYCANSINELQMGSVETGFTGVTAEQIMNSPEPMPWGSPVAEDRNCEESFWHGTGNFAKNTAVGVTSLAGFDFDPTTARGQTAKQSWLGMGDFVASAGMALVPVSYLAYVPAVSDSQVAQFVQDRHHTALTGAGSMIGWDEAEAAAGGDGWHAWKEDPVAAFTESALGIGSMFIPVGGWAAGGGKLATGAGRAGRAAKGARGGKRVRGDVADLVVPGGEHLAGGTTRVFSKDMETSRGRTDVVEDVDLDASTAPGKHGDGPDSDRAANPDQPRGGDEPSQRPSRTDAGSGMSPKDSTSGPTRSGSGAHPESNSPDGPPAGTEKPAKQSTDAGGTSAAGSESPRPRPGDGTKPTASHPGTYDPHSTPRETMPAKDAGVDYKPKDVQEAVDNAPQNKWGDPVDHRNGKPLLLENINGDRGWVMRWDPDSGDWVAENRGLGEHGLPAKGEPGSYGYDANGDRLPYANHRPDYAKGQVEEVWDVSREEQVRRIEHGDLPLPELKSDREMWVRTPDDATGSDLVNLGEKGKWRLIEWEPNQSRRAKWEMGHVYGEEYSLLRERYLSHEIDKDEFLEIYRDVDNYEVQDPARNHSHVDEMPRSGGNATQTSTDMGVS